MLLAKIKSLQRFGSLDLWIFGSLDLWIFVYFSFTVVFLKTLVDLPWMPKDVQMERSGVLEPHFDCHNEFTASILD